jgi:HAD superfamily hydrolase (TIGR01509 family)
MRTPRAACQLGRVSVTEVRGVLLDVDGTLIDSNDAHAEAWVRALAEGGFEVPFARVRHLIGMGGDKLLPEVSGLADETPQGARISERRGAIFAEEFLPHLRPFPRVRELLERLRADGLRLVVASSSEREQLDALLDGAGIADLLDETISSSDAAQSKPAPDLVGAALEKSGLTPEAAIMLGDTPYDIEAARKLGVRTIAVRCGGFSDRELAGAVAIYDDPADLLARYGESPLTGRVGASQ